MQTVRDVFPKMYEAVKATHGSRVFYGHDLLHVERVGNVAMAIAEYEQAARLAGAAGLCHNADRIIQVRRGLDREAEVDKDELVAMIAGWLDTEAFNACEREWIIQAVLGHSARNSPDDSPVLVALMDADRIVNTDADCIIRNGMYFGDDLPAVDAVNFLSDPTASWRNLKSNIRGLWERIDWYRKDTPVSLRLPKARALMESRWQFYQMFFAKVEAQLQEEGVFGIE